jgi:methylamine utilization protein MauE
VLATVFGVAGWAKLRDRAGVRQAVVDFALPARFAVPVATVLPLAELYIAGLLLVPPLAVWGAAGAAVLLMLFTIGVAVALARGTRPDCHCFGQLRVAPVNGATVAHNVVLLALAALVIGLR